MNRFRLATSATLAGVLFAAGCASPCGGCGGGAFQRMSMFRARTPCPCECCSSCGGGAPIVGSGAMMAEGPLLEPPGPPVAAVPSPGLPPAGVGMPTPLPPSLGAPLGSPALPADPGRLNPVPAQPFSAEPSSRVRRR